MTDKKPTRHIDIAIDVLNTHRRNVIRRKLQLDAAVNRVRKFDEP